MFARKSLVAAVLAATTSIMTGCSSLPQSSMSEIINESKVPVTGLEKGLIGGQKMKPIEYRPLSRTDYFKLVRLVESEPVPDIQIEPFTITNGSPYDAMRLLLEGTGLNVTMPSSVAIKTGVYTSYMEGSLESVVSRLADSINVFWYYKNGGFNLKESERFVFKMPPMISVQNAEAIKNSLERIGANDVALDTQFNTVVLTAKKNTLPAIERYVENVNLSSSLVVYDTWIWEVTLSEGYQTGIKWENFKLGDSNFSITGSGGFASDPATTKDLVGGLSYATPNLSLSMLMSFLEEHGELETLSHPKLSALSGTEAELSVGEKEDYLSELASTVSTTGDTTQSTATTKTLETGLSLKVRPNYEAGSVFTELQLKISDFIRFKDVVASGTTLSLPKTMDRELKTVTRIQPGEFFILGGVNLTRKSKDSAGVPLSKSNNLEIPVSRSEETEKSELVMVMRPRVVLFSEPPVQPEKEVGDES